MTNDYQDELRILLSHVAGIGVDESKFIEDILKFADAYTMIILGDTIRSRGKGIIPDKFR